MDADDLHPQDDYSHRFFIWHEWIQANGPLNTEAQALDYFTTSMYYDKQSNNQVLRMQTMHTGQPLLNEAEELSRFTGIEFAIVHAQPPSLFVIHKRERLSPDQVRPLAAYFITNNRIYQSPSIYTVVSNRLLTTLHALQSSLDILRANRPDFTPRAGFGWPIVEPASANAPSDLPSSQKSKAPGSQNLGLDDTVHDSTFKEGENPSTKDAQTAAVRDSSSHAKKEQNFSPLFIAMLTTAAHSNQTFSSRLLAEQESSEAVNLPTNDSRELSRAASTPALASDPGETNIGASGSGGMITASVLGASGKAGQLQGAGPPPESAASNASRPSTSGGKKKKKKETSGSGIFV